MLHKILSANTDTLIKEFEVASKMRQLRRHSVSEDRVILTTDNTDEKVLWESLIKKILERDTHNYIPMLYQALGVFMELNYKPPCCMMCLRTKDPITKKALKIADSHYVSKSILEHVSPHFLTDGSDTLKSALKITLKLLCTGTETECEQTLSKKGEDPFKKLFLPFIEQLRQKHHLSSDSEVSVEYDQWLFYDIISLTWRHLLTSLSETDSWSKITEESGIPKAQENFWEFFENMRQFLLGKTDASKLSITLYLSGNGLNFPHQISEDPIVHTSQYLHGGALQTPVVLFGITGCYFVITPNNPDVQTVLQSEGFHRKGFNTKIENTSGRISVKYQVFTLPKRVKEWVEEYSKHIVQKAYQKNSEVIKENAKKQGIKEAKMGPVVFPTVVAETIIHLPPGIEFSMSTKATDWWSAGSLKLDSKFELLAIDHRKPPCPAASWLLKNKFENYFCFVMHVAEPGQPRVICCYEFDMAAISKEALTAITTLKDLELIDYKLKPCRNTDHSHFVLSDPDYPKIILSFLLLQYFK